MNIPRIAFSIYLLLGLLPVSLEAQFQELPVSTSLRYNLDNPAIVGLDGRHHVILGNYTKWLGMSGSPSSTYLSTAHPISGGRLGIGLFLLNDQATILRQTRVAVHAAVNLLDPQRDGQFSIGTAIQYLQLGLKQPENPFDAGDPLLNLIEPFSKGLFNLGLAANYHHKLGSGSFLNAMLYFPQLPRTISLVDSAGMGSSLGYHLSQNFILQANMQYRLNEDLSLLPSIRLHFFPAQTDKNVPAYSIIDIGVGLGIRQEQISIKAGFRSAEANQLYAALSFRFNNLNVNVLTEPVGIFGSSLGVDLEYMTGTPVPQWYAWQADTFLQNRLLRRGIAGSFTSDAFNVPNSETSYIRHFFFDNSDQVYEYTRDADFVSLVNLPELFKELNDLYSQVRDDKGKIISLRIEVETVDPLSEITEESYSGNTEILTFFSKWDKDASGND